MNYLWARGKLMVEQQINNEEDTPLITLLTHSTKELP